MNTPLKTLDARQFFREVGQFRKLMSDAEFMRDDDRKDVAIKALSCTYLNCTFANEAELNSCACILQATIDEFHRREFHVLSRTTTTEGTQ